MVGDTGCCGYNFKEKGPNFFGLVTFSIPVIISGCAMLVFLFPLGLIYRGLHKLKEQVLIIIKANLYLIHTRPFYPKIRCKLAGKIFPQFPKFSGIIYRNFNFAVMILLWAGVIFPIIVVIL